MLLPFQTFVPRIQITEQPAERHRFRYASEHPSYIRGSKNTRECLTYPTVEIVDYFGRAKLTVYSVTEDPIPRLHPYTLSGTCEVIIGPNNPLKYCFKDLSICCITRKMLRRQHANDLDVVNLNVLRLCFEASLLTASGEVTQTLRAFSRKIYNAKKRPELIIHELSDCSSPMSGGKNITLLCDEVDKNDIQVRFSLCRSNQSEGWCGYGIFHPEADIHKKVAISFMTPPFRNQFLTQSVKVGSRCIFKTLMD
ncbi:proto-oncogene c-Rel-like [Toxorhynchites rutilus septentrionalis]|uniref:proto-oncogene c-Rel-like n=1 Tax=Toxorhynchites rutilus septentrionalis TaxID=329112 RepID=UPI002479D5EB|nr:proto-oncogene c-Rel-like [Toxorhynchites rutilus septentrionalis]